MPFRIILDDIVNVSADAIVNSANPMPVIGRGVDSAIYEAAGRDSLLERRVQLGEIMPGTAAATGAGALKAKYIIHTVGPRWIDGRQGELITLASCYRESLLLAQRLGCRSIAFPLISTGVYRFPKDRALEIALREIRGFLDWAEMDVTLVVYDRSAYQLSAGLVTDVQRYIGGHVFSKKQDYRREDYPEEADRQEDRRLRRARRRREGGFPSFGNMAGPAVQGAFFDEEESTPVSAPYVPMADMAFGAAPSAPRRLEDVVSQVGETFQQMLLRYIDESGRSDSEIYKKANIDRKHFSKIRCNPHYHPTKRTALALAVALELDEDRTADLLRRAGLALSPSDVFDLIVSYCIENKKYDVYEVNSILFRYDQPLLGS